MRKTVSMVAILAVWAAARAAAITNVNEGTNTIRWDANCDETKSFHNNTGRPICDLRLVKISGGNATTHVRDLRVEDGIGNWRVDDDADGALAGGEADQEDATPASPTRVARSPGPPPVAAAAGLCVAKDANFGIRLCGDDTATGADDNTPLNGFEYALRATSESGADIVALSDCRRGSQVVVLARKESANPLLLFSIQGESGARPLTGLTLRSRTRRVSVVEASADPRAEFDPASGRLTFARGLAPGTAVTVDFRLNRLGRGTRTRVSVTPCLRPPTAER